MPATPQSFILFISNIFRNDFFSRFKCVSKPKRRKNNTPQQLWFYIIVVGIYINRSTSMIHSIPTYKFNIFIYLYVFLPHPLTPNGNLKFRHASREKSKFIMPHVYIHVCVCYTNLYLSLYTHFIKYTFDIDKCCVPFFGLRYDLYWQRLGTFIYGKPTSNWIFLCKQKSNSWTRQNWWNVNHRFRFLSASFMWGILYT